MRCLRVHLVDDPAVDIFRQQSFMSRLAKETNINVDLRITPWSDYATEFEQHIQPDGYDIVMIPGHVWLHSLVAKGVLVDLTQSGLSIDLSLFRSEIVADISEGSAIYGIPLFTDGHIFIYNNRFNEYLKDVVHDRNSYVSTSIILETLQRGCNSELTIAMKSHPSEIFLDFLPYLIEESNTPTLPTSITAFQRAMTRYKAMKFFAIRGTEYFGNEDIARAITMGFVDCAVTWGGQLGYIWRLLDPAQRQSFQCCTLVHPWNTTWSLSVNRNRVNQAIAVEFLKAYSRKISHEVDPWVARYAGSPVLHQSYERESTLPYLRAQSEMLTRSHRLPLKVEPEDFWPQLSELLWNVFVDKTSIEEACHQYMNIFHVKSRLGGN